MSRPKVNETERRIVQVNIRLTQEENGKVNEYAISSGLSPANWIRHKIFTGKNPPIKVSAMDATVYQELKRIGVNLNQVAHKLNQGDFPQDLRITQTELLRLLTTILKTLLHDREHDKG
ncbi:MAG: plasmid mobilization relaxosome protein MobC [Chryseolinea sp.]